MTAVLTKPSPPRPANGDRRRPAGLDRVVAEAWAEIGAHRVTTCLLCGHPMVPVYGAQSRPVGARCTACGTELV